MHGQSVLRLINWRFVGPALLCIAVAIAILAMAIRLYRHREHSMVPPSAPAETLSSDDLGHELSHCQLLGAVAQSDRHCIATWAESRRRFFGGGTR